MSSYSPFGTIWRIKSVKIQGHGLTWPPPSRQMTEAEIETRMTHRMGRLPPGSIRITRRATGHRARWE